MAKILEFGPYKIFIWSNEHNEPLHVYVTKVNPHTHSPKFWITSRGTVVADPHNNDELKSHEIKSIQKFIETNIDTIKSEWLKFHEDITYIK